METLFIHFPFSIRAIIAILIDNQITISKTETNRNPLPPRSGNKQLGRTAIFRSLHQIQLIVLETEELKKQTYRQVAQR